MSTQVIMPRRGFLTRALGFTAAGATLALPIITVDNAEARVSHHLKGLTKALQDLYPRNKIGAHFRFLNPEETDHRLDDRFLVVIKTEVA
jgi:hypothetical protein